MIIQIVIKKEYPLKISQHHVCFLFKLELTNLNAKKIL